MTLLFTIHKKKKKLLDNIFLKAAKKYIFGWPTTLAFTQTWWFLVFRWDVFKTINIFARWCLSPPPTVKVFLFCQKPVLPSGVHLRLCLRLEHSQRCEYLYSLLPARLQKMCVILFSFLEIQTTRTCYGAHFM